MSKETINTPDSECFSSISRNGDKVTMNFRKGKNKVHTKQMSQEQFNDFKNADSKGAHFNNKIK